MDLHVSLCPKGPKAHEANATTTTNNHQRYHVPRTQHSICRPNKNSVTPSVANHGASQTARYGTLPAKDTQARQAPSSKLQATLAWSGRGSLIMHKGRDSVTVASIVISSAADTSPTCLARGCGSSLSLCCDGDEVRFWPMANGLAIQ